MDLCLLEYGLLDMQSLLFYPMIHSFYLSLNKAFYNIETGIQTEYLGFVNYLNIFRSSTLLPLYFNYITKTLIAVPIIIIFFDYNCDVN